MLALALLLMPALLPGQVDELRRLKTQAQRATGVERLAAWQALYDLGDQGQALLRQLLVEQDKKLKGQVGRTFGSAAFSAATQGLASELDRARKTALVYIRNPQLFRKGFGIKGMTDRVDVIKRLWNQPEKYLGSKVETLVPLLAEGRELSEWGERLKLKSLFATRLPDRVQEVSGVHQVGASQGQLKWNREVMAWNAGNCPTSANADEVLVVRLTNEYRMMMGFKALELDERILRAARAHSQEMEDLNYFSHTSPVAGHADFATRLRQKGYSGPVNENIATTTNAPGAFHGWYLSAGHHRNMLHKGSTAMAVGRSRGKGGFFKWTMNLGAGDSLRGRKLTDPSLLYLQKKRQYHNGTAEGHLKMARWCKAQGLTREMCKECRAALRLDPRAKEAREMLMERFKKRRR